MEKVYLFFKYEKHLTSMVFVPVKTVNRKTYRNVFEGFKIVVDDSSAVFSTEEL